MHIKHLFTLCFLLLSFSCLHAQDSNAITGRLIDENGQAVEFANIFLQLHENDSIIAGSVTDTNGSFSISANEGKYILVASAVGYERLSISCGIAELGDILMPRVAEMLDEVMVEASRVIEKADRFLVLPDPKESQAAGQSLTLLGMQQLPGLKVDVALQKITVDNGTPILQINGKEVTQARFASVKPEKIKRIEYSNNPGIRYLDRGATGIINLVLKEAEDGGSIVANGNTAFTTGFANGYFMGSYHKGRSEFSLQYNTSYRNYQDTPNQLIDNYISPEHTIERRQEQNRPFSYNTHDIAAEYTFQFNDSTMFIATLSDMIYNHHVNHDGSMIEIDNGTADTIRMTNVISNATNEPVLDLFYSKKLKKDQSIEFNIVGQYSTSKYDKRLSYLEADNESIYPVKNENHGYSVIGEGVYSKQFKKTKTRFGLQYQHNFAQNNYILYNTISEMTKDNAYLFGEMQGTFGKRISYTIGTGMKIFSFIEDANRQNYIRNLSTVRLNWLISDRWSLSANAGLTPSLPSLSELSPILQLTDNVEAVMGNEHLTPSNNISSRLQARYNSPKKWFVNASAGYNHHLKPIFYTYDYDPSQDLFIRSPHNGNFYSSLRMTAEAGAKDLLGHFNVSVSGTWHQDNSSDVGFYHTHTNFYSNIHAEAIWEQFLFGLNFDLTPYWSLYGENLSRSEISQMIYAQYNWKDMYISVIWHCPFNKDGYAYESKSVSAVHPYQQRNWIPENGNMIVLDLTWQMQYGKAFRKGNKTLNNGGYDNGMIKAE